MVKEEPKIDKNFLEQTSEGSSEQVESDSDDQFIVQKAKPEKQQSLLERSWAEFEETSGWECGLDDVIDEINDNIIEN